MRYSMEPKYRKYIKGYSFLSFTEDLIGNKISDKITSLGRTKSKKKMKNKKSTYHQKNNSKLLMT